MKICLITTAYPDWSEGNTNILRGKFVHDMAKYLVKAGVEVHVVTHHGKITSSIEKKDGVIIHYFHYFFKYKWETLIKGAGIPENIKKIKNLIQIFFYFSSLLWLSFKVIKNYKIDFINAHWVFPTGYMGLLLKKITGKKLIITAYGAELFPVLAGRMGYLKLFLKKCIKGADIVAGISPETVRAVKKISGRKDIHVIPDGIDISHYKKGLKNIILLKKYNCYCKKVIFFTGRMVERKGHKYLLEAMRYIKNKIPNVKLILGGQGPLMNELTNLRNKWELYDCVEMPGYIAEKDIIPLLQSINLYVLPSCIDKKGDTEGSATAALEAMACGKTALISKIGGNRGAIEEGKGAYYFKPMNARNLADRINMIINNNKLLHKNESMARTYIIKHYSWEKIINRYLDLLKNLPKTN